MAKRIKAAAAPNTVQTQDDLVNSLARLGELEQTRAQCIAEAEAECRDINQTLGLAIKPLEEELAQIARDIQGYAEAHRHELTDGGKVKTARLATGELGWRNDPPSVSVPRDQAAQLAIIEALTAIDPAFVRTLRVIDKEAILALRSRFDATPAASLLSIELGEKIGAVEAINGIKIKTDVEKFFIKPKGVAEPEQASAAAEAVEVAA